MVRHVVANLYGEEEHRSHACGVPPRPLKKPAQRALAVAGALARVLAGTNDALWLEAAIDLERVSLPERFRPNDLRVGRPHPPAGGDGDTWYWMTPPAVAPAPWVRRDWAAMLAPTCDPEFRTHVVRSEREFRAAAVRAIADSPLDRWIAKTNFSAAGRERWTGDASTPPRELLAAVEVEGSVVVEPWVERLADFGLCGTAADEGERSLPAHELVNDAEGHFRGIRLHRDASPISSLQASEAEQLAESFERVRTQLRASGYFGSFGIDAFRYRDPTGASAFRTLVEVNPRCSMGALARRWVDALTESELPNGDELELVISRKRSAPDGATVLVTPDGPDRTAVWLESSSR